MHNSQFNLFNQLVQEQKSLWRIEQYYVNDALSKDEQKFWKGLASKKRKIISEIEMLTKEVK